MIRSMGFNLPDGLFSRPIFWAGLILFASAFFLPAVRMPPSTGPSGGGPGSRSTDFLGWECAEITPIFTVRLLQSAFEPHRVPRDLPAWELPLLALSGWISPLVFFYLLSWVVKELSRFRRFLAGLIVLALIAMWIVLTREHFTLLLGHYLWVMGIVLMLTAPFVGQRSVVIRQERL